VLLTAIYTIVFICIAENTAEFLTEKLSYLDFLLIKIF